MLGVLGLIGSGVRAYYRKQRLTEIQRVYRELTAEPIEYPTSATTPARALLLAQLRQQLAAACPEDWTVGELEDEIITVGSASGPPVLLVELAPPGGGPRHGHSGDLREAGAGCYWLVDPVWPALTVLELKAGEYVETARADGPAFTATVPLAVTLDLQVPDGAG